MNIGKIISFHEITYINGRDETAMMFRVCCSGAQARELAEKLETKGWLVKSIAMTSSMDFDSAVEHVGRVGENRVKETIQ